MIIPFAAALQFLLVSPAFIRRAFTPAEMGRSIAFYPAVGALLGGLLAGVDAVLGMAFPTEVRSALVLFLWIVLTGALHFDGLLDSADGLLGGDSPAHRMEIMRDERVGAYGVAAAGLILLTMFAALNTLPGERWPALVLAPVLGRCGISLSIASLTYVRKHGLGRDIKDNARPAHAVIAALSTLALTALIFWRTQHLAAAAAVLTSVVIGILLARFVVGRIGGMTGDTYGAMSMLIELGVMLTFVVGP
jgi:cobalamin 5'-phosphate synthase/cobalamin synthase